MRITSLTIRFGRRRAPHLGRPAFWGHRMVTHLDIAVGIADAISDATLQSAPLPIEATARTLLEDGAPLPLTFDLVATVLREEGACAGLPLS